VRQLPDAAHSDPAEVARRIQGIIQKANVPHPPRPDARRPPPTNVGGEDAVFKRQERDGFFRNSNR